MLVAKILVCVACMLHWHNRPWRKQYTWPSLLPKAQDAGASSSRCSKLGQRLASAFRRFLKLETDRDK